MQGKEIHFLAALVVFAAFALVPAISSAHGLLDTSGGVTTTTAVGSKLVAYNESGTEPEFTGSGLTTKCSQVSMTGSVHANPHTIGGAVLWTIESVSFRGAGGGDCTSNLGSASLRFPALTNEGGAQHWCIKLIPETESFNFEPHSCGGTGGEFTYVLVTGSLTCKYKRAPNIAGTFTTTNATHSAATLTMTNGQEFTLEEGGFLCPAAVKWNNLKLELFTDTGAAWRNAASVADPVWIT